MTHEKKAQGISAPMPRGLLTGLILIGTVAGTLGGLCIGAILFAVLGEKEPKTFDGPDGPYEDMVVPDESLSYFYLSVGYGAMAGFLMTCMYLAFDFMKTQQQEVVNKSGAVERLRHFFSFKLSGERYSDSSGTGLGSINNAPPSLTPT